MRKPLLAGNWKMNKTIDEALQFAQAISGRLPDKEELDTVICAPFITLPALTAWAEEEQGIGIGAQTMHHEEAGAFTGEISPVMLRSMGVRYVIVGHSERRQFFSETDESVSLKVAAAHQHHLVPIICVGEHWEEREAGETEKVVQQQVNKALSRITAEQAACSVIAYEPIWAIGSGQTPSTTEANQVMGQIRQTVAEQCGDETAAQIRLLYGGSVKPDNIGDFMKETEIDGALVGGASLEAESFLQLVKGCQS